MSFAVIDFETTGFAPERHDRIVEVGIVQLDLEGQTEFEWTTLINPNRDVGATHIHGITAADLLEAPAFAEVADYVLSLLKGRIVVAHNASYDMRFLHQELRRANYPISQRPAALCSMKWGGRVIGSAKLIHCCEALGIPLTDAHTALGDARATALLVRHLLDACCKFDDWLVDLRRCANYSWPNPINLACKAIGVLRGESTHDPYKWLRAVLSAAWVPADPEDEASYLLILDNALLDRVISRTEGKQLMAAAEAAGLTRATVGRLHQDYLREIAREALDDGFVTDDERRDLESVAAALGLGIPYVDEALSWAAATSRPAINRSNPTLRRGDRVVFTGEMARDRGEWIAAICAAGLTSGAVTKSTKLVVAADPDSMSGKAAQARTYQIPVVNEEAFERIFSRYCNDVVP